MSIKGKVGYLKEKFDIYITNGVRADLIGLLLLTVYILGSNHAIIAVTAAVLALSLYCTYKNKSTLPSSPIIYLVPVAYVANIWLGSPGQWQYASALLGSILAILYALYKPIRKRTSGRDIIALGLPEDLRGKVQSEPVDYLPVIIMPIALLAFILNIYSPALTFVVLSFLAVMLVIAAALALLGRKKSLVYDEQVVQVIEEYKPEFIFFFALGKPSYHVYTMWQEYFDRLDKAYIILTPQRRHLESLAGIAKTPVVFCRGSRGMEQVIGIDSVKAVFYPTNSPHNMTAMITPTPHHVQIFHGDSDKGPSYRSIVAMYDKLFIAGQAGIDRYKDHGVSIPREKFVIVGRPQVEDINLGSGTGVKSVLYAPTWQGDVEAFDYSSLYKGREITKSLIRSNLRVIFRPHPSSKLSSDLSRAIDDIHSILADDNQKTGRGHIYGDAAEKNLDIIDCMNESDMMISDVSSVISDYLYSEKPMVLVAMKEDVDSFIKTYPTARAAYVVDASLEGLDGIIASLTEGKDSMIDTRKNLKSHYLSSAQEGKPYSDLFISAIHKVLKEPNPRRQQAR